MMKSWNCIIRLNQFPTYRYVTFSQVSFSRQPRTKKTSTVSGTTEYTLHGENIVHMKKGTDEMHFFYGADNKPAIVVCNGTSYRYMYTLQGDVFGLVDESNTFVVWYYIEMFYNRKRLHSTLGYMSPVAYRLQHCQAKMA